MCDVLGKNSKRPNWNYKLGSNDLQVSSKEKDLGGVITNKLSPYNREGKKHAKLVVQ